MRRPIEILVDFANALQEILDQHLSPTEHAKVTKFGSLDEVVTEMRFEAEGDISKVVYYV